MMIALLILSSLASLVAAEVAHRRFGASVSLTRRFTHVATSVVAAVAAFFASPEAIALIALFAAFGAIAARRLGLLPSIHGVARVSAGDACLALGIAAAAYLFLPEDRSIYLFSVLVVGISDALAGLVGEQFGRHRVRFASTSKSLEGSSAFFFSTLLMGLATLSAGLPALIAIALALVLVECLPYGLDNLALPIAAGYLVLAFA